MITLDEDATTGILIDQESAEEPAETPTIHAATWDTASGNISLVRATQERDVDGETVTLVEDLVHKDGDPVLHRRQITQNGETVTHVQRM